jgi:DNA replication protein DnaC
MKEYGKRMPDNPFTPTFGSIPPLFAGRERMIEDVVTGLDNAPGDPNRSTIFIGARGTGKTALLAKIAEEAGKIN